jgi:FixJ family two-component response regulator
MGGLALQQRLVGNDHRIPTIVLTAHGGADVRERTLAAGAIAFLTKPFDADVLLTAVAAALKSR